MVGDDPVKLGLVASLNRPGGNATGVNYFLGELVAKRLGLLRELLPNAARFGVMINPNSQSAASTIEELTGAAEDEATSREAFSGGPAPGERAQLQALIGLRLAQAKSDFDAMVGRERDDVFDENYKTLLDRVFNLLIENGVTFPEVERPTEQHMQSM